MVNNRPVNHDATNEYELYQDPQTKHYFITIQKPHTRELWIRKTPSHDQPTEDDEPYELYTYEEPTTKTWSPVRERLRVSQVMLPRLMYPNV